MFRGKSTLHIVPGKASTWLVQATTQPTRMFHLARYYMKLDGRDIQVALATDEQFTRYITRYYVTERTSWHPCERLQVFKELAGAHILPELYVPV